MTSVRRTLWTLLRVAMAVALVTYLSRSGLLNWSALRGLSTRWPLSAMALSLLLLCMLATAWRLRILMRPHGFRLAFDDAVRLTLIGVFFSFFLPGATGGDAARIYYATAGNRGKRTEVATIMMLDRIIGMVALLLLPLLVAPFFVPLITTSPVLTVLLVAASLLTSVLSATLVLATLPEVRGHRFVRRLTAALPLSSVWDRMLDTMHAYRHDRHILLSALGASLVAHGSAVMAAMAVAYAVTPSGMAAELAILIPLGFMANTVPITPAGIGVGEVAFDRLYGLAGLTGGAATLLGWRVILLLVGGMGLLAYLQGRARFIHSEEEGAGGSRTSIRATPAVTAALGSATNTTTTGAP